jgi:membrane associated rhomboid family serine protease
MARSDSLNGHAEFSAAGHTEDRPDDARDPLAGLTAFGPVGERKAREWSLVLQSMAIWHAARWTSGGWIVVVRDAEYERASRSIDRYESENRDWPPRRTRERLRYAGVLFAPALFVVLAVFFFTVTGPSSSGSRWFREGAAVANLLLEREPWRAVTALTLHADGSHVIGNLISGAVFASAVERRLGPGVAAFTVLASGVAGAFAHRVIGQGGHGSIGASTAVFGAIGVLAATQLLVDRNEEAHRTRSWLEKAGPIVGGLALLGALGTSPRADLGAHLFGLLSGGVLGALAALGLGSDTRRSRWWLQAGLGAIAVASVIVAWQAAL